MLRHLRGTRRGRYRGFPRWIVRKRRECSCNASLEPHGCSWICSGSCAFARDGARNPNNFGRVLAVASFGLANYLVEHRHRCTGNDRWVASQRFHRRASPVNRHGSASSRIRSLVLASANSKGIFQGYEHDCLRRPSFALADQIGPGCDRSWIDLGALGELRRIPACAELRSVSAASDQEVLRMLPGRVCRPSCAGNDGARLSGTHLLVGRRIPRNRVCSVFILRRKACDPF
jgi:hypothetical protein